MHAWLSSISVCAGVCVCHMQPTNYKTFLDTSYSTFIPAMDSAAYVHVMHALNS